MGMDMDPSRRRAFEGGSSYTSCWTLAAVTTLAWVAMLAPTQQREATPT
jgi:hypothetical protein